MKKYVLSAVVTSLLVPWAYAMDGGAAPAVEVEVPAVETPAVEEVAVDVGEVAPIEVTALEVEVGLEEPKPEVDPGDPVLLGLPEVIEGESGTTDDRPEVCEFPHEIVVDGSVDCPVGGVDENGHQVWIVSGGVDSVELPVDVDGNPIAVCYFGGVFMEPVEGEAIDPNLVDLASQSGISVDENGRPLEGEVIDLSFQGGSTTSVDENGDPVIYYFAAANGEELPQSAPVGGGGEDEVTAVEDSPIRLHGDIQPNFRSNLTDRGPEALAASSNAIVAEAPAETQLLNDEQRGAVRGLRSDEEPAKPRSGMSKLLSKFRKPKAEVTLASATTTTDKALSSKLAEVDRLRDTALRTGDQKMLAKADKLERELRAKAGKVTKIPTRTK